MARKKFTTKKPGARRAPSPPPPADGKLAEAIETERSRLMTADSVLACAQIALDPQSLTPGPEPYLPAVLTIARKLINKSINHLDCVELERRSHRAKS